MLINREPVGTADKLDGGFWFHDPRFLSLPFLRDSLSVCTPCRYLQLVCMPNGSKAVLVAVFMP